MEQVRYATEDVYEGPFLIDANDLQKLDTVIDTQWEELEQWHRSNVEEEADQRIADPQYTSYRDLDRKEVIAKVAQDYEWRGSERNVEVLFRGDKAASDESFKKLLSRPDLRDLVPTGFSVTLRKGPIQAEINSSHRAFSTDGYSVKINNHCQVAYEVKAALGQWLSEVSPKWWMRWWAKATWVFPIQWVLVILLSYILFLSWVDSDSPREIALQAHRSKLQHEAVVLLEDGYVAEDEVPDALRISLELSTEYLPPDTVVGPRKFPTAWFWVIGIAVVLALLLSFRPRFELAVGKGSVRVKVWGVWLKFVGVTLPLGVLIYVVLPLLSTWLWG